jgi:hypothetical protein
LRKAKIRIFWRRSRCSAVATVFSRDHPLRRFKVG